MRPAPPTRGPAAIGAAVDAAPRRSYGDDIMVEDKKTPPARSDDDDAAAADGEARGFGSKSIGDMARRALMSGIGAVFLSEENLRQQLSEMKLGKDAVGYVVGQVDKTKREIIDVVARETRAFLSRLEVEKMVGRMLMGTTIEVQTRIRILPNKDGGVGVNVERNDATFVKSDVPSDAPATAPMAAAPAGDDRPRRGRRKSDRKQRDDDDDDEI
ncbi:MAG: hypothetical protein FJ137_03735 [Deltaproteobacteria bacterium]|nr:hypothetical protein [Deltaproteobacteria bacterium]